MRRRHRRHPGSRCIRPSCRPLAQASRETSPGRNPHGRLRRQGRAFRFRRQRLHSAAASRKARSADCRRPPSRRNQATSSPWHRSAYIFPPDRPAPRNTYRPNCRRRYRLGDFRAGSFWWPRRSAYRCTDRHLFGRQERRNCSCRNRRRSFRYRYRRARRRSRNRSRTRLHRV